MSSAAMILWVLVFPAIFPGGEAGKEACWTQGIQFDRARVAGGDAEKEASGPWLGQRGQRFYGEAAGHDAEEFDIGETLEKSVLLCEAMDSIAADSSEQPAPQAPSQKEDPLEDEGEMEEASEGEEEIEVASEQEVKFVGGFFSMRGLLSGRYMEILELPRGIPSGGDWKRLLSYITLPNSI